MYVALSGYVYIYCMYIASEVNQRVGVVRLGRCIYLSMWMYLC